MTLLRLGRKLNFLLFESLATLNPLRPRFNQKAKSLFLASHWTPSEPSDWICVKKFLLDNGLSRCIGFASDLQHRLLCSVCFQKAQQFSRTGNPASATDGSSFAETAHTQTVVCARSTQKTMVLCCVSQRKGWCSPWPDLSLFKKPRNLFATFDSCISKQRGFAVVPRASRDGQQMKASGLIMKDKTRLLCLCSASRQQHGSVINRYPRPLVLKLHHELSEIFLLQFHVNLVHL